jgi:hypothetical protein
LSAEGNTELGWQRTNPAALAGASIMILFVVLLAAASTARADYRTGSTHSMLDHGRLALPLPAVRSIPTLRPEPGGSIHISAAVDYRAANWRGGRHVARDRTMVTITVARRVIATGAVRSDPAFRRVIVARLHRRKVARRYGVLLPRRVSDLLRRRGVFARNLRRRASALRLVTLDVQQDRDFRHVDGSYDWREGSAYSAADALLARLREGGARRESAHASSSYRNPTGTLTVINNTAAGVYCETDCPLVESSSGLPGTVSGTMNNPEYEAELAVAGGALECFDQGSNGSDPEGFANFDAAGEPQPYLPGEVLPGSSPYVTDTTGTAVTEGLAADYTLAWASSEEVADESGAISGAVKLSLQAVKALAGGFVSPGAVITGALGIFEFFLQNSCKESGNFFNISATEPSGGTTSETINTDDGNWATYPGTGSTAYGLQMNPSKISFEGTRLHLAPVAPIAEGLADNSCIGCAGNNVVELDWDNYEPCPATYDCHARPPLSPRVESSVGDIDCGKDNLECPFPAAGWPSQPAGPPIYAGLSSGGLWLCSSTTATSCQVLDNAGNEINALDLGAGSLWAGISDGVLWKCPPAEANACVTLDEAGSKIPINAVAYSAGAVYAGLSDGILWKCSPTVVNACETFDRDTDAHGSANALATSGEAIYAGLGNGVLWRCSPTVANSCQSLDEAGKNSIESIAYANGKIYAGISNGVVWECAPNQANACTTLGTAPGNVTSVAFSAGRVFAAYEKNGTEKGIWRCIPSLPGSCESWSGVLANVLDTAGNSLYVGAVQNLVRCSAVDEKECKTLDETSSSKTTIESLVVPTSR